MRLVSEGYSSISGYKGTKETLVSQGVVDSWLQTIQTLAEEDSGEDILLLFHFQKRLFLDFLDYIESISYSNSVIEVFKGFLRNNQKVLKTSVLAQTFDLLEQLASRRNKYSGIFYKLLVFQLIEHHETQEVKELLITNFTQVISRFQSIPLNVLLDPLGKQYQISATTNYINTYDLLFYRTVINHKKLALANAQKIVDTFLSLSQANTLYQTFSFSLVKTLVGRFAGETEF